MSADVTTIRDTLNLQHIELLAGEACWKINRDGWVAVRLVPGDMTQYRIIVTPNEGLVESPDGGAVWEVIGSGWIVTLVGEGSYPWPGFSDLHPSYVATHWTHDGRLWTGVVLAEFLNALGRRLSEVP